MGLETGTYIDDLNPANPNGSPDTVAEGDNHIRLIKSVLQNSFPDVSEAMSLDSAIIGNYFVAAAGTVDAITADFTPNVTLADGITVLIRASGANTITNPTFAPDGLTAHTIVKNGGNALAIGDIKGADHVLILQYNLSNTEWELLNPAVVINPHRGALVWNSVNQSIPDATGTMLTFDTENYDTDSFHDGVNPSRLTVPTGVTKVRVLCEALFAANATGVRSLNILKNGASYAGSPGATAGLTALNLVNLVAVSTVINVVPTDYFEIEVFQSSGGALNMTGGASGGTTWFAIEVIE